MESTSQPSLSHPKTPSDFPGGMHKNAKLEAGKTPSPLTGRKSKRIVKNQGVERGGEERIEDAFNELEREVAL